MLMEIPWMATFPDLATYEVCLTVHYQCRSDEFCQTVDIAGDTGEKELSTTLTIYPNPANGFIRMQLMTVNKIGDLKIELWDQLGKKAFQKSLIAYSNSWNEQIAIDHLPSGIYLLNVFSDGQQVSGKFVKTTFY